MGLLLKKRAISEAARTQSLKRFEDLSSDRTLIDRAGDRSVKPDLSTSNAVIFRIPFHALTQFLASLLFLSCELHFRVDPLTLMCTRTSRSSFSFFFLPDSPRDRGENPKTRNPSFQLDRSDRREGERQSYASKGRHPNIQLFIFYSISPRPGPGTISWSIFSFQFIRPKEILEQKIEISFLSIIISPLFFC